MSNDQIVTLNVGGQQFVTTRATLSAVKGSMLANMVQDFSESELFLDRDSFVFSYVLHYLRDGCRVTFDLPMDILKQLRADAEYYGLADLVQHCDDAMSNEIVKLNVGGRHFITTRKTLCAVSDSKLAKMFSKDSQEHRLIAGGQVFLDHNPVVFSLILDYLRGNNRSVANDTGRETLEQLRTDAYHFGLYDLIIIADDAISKEQKAVTKPARLFNRHYEEMQEQVAESNRLLLWIQRTQHDVQEALEATDNEQQRRLEPIDEAMIVGMVVFGIFLGGIILFIANRIRFS